MDTGETITRLARNVTGLPVLANGGMHAPELARTVLDEGHADVVTLGRGAPANPDWPQVIAAGERPAEFDRALLTPDVTLASQKSWNARVMATAV
ncbi:tRNA-dihydrouridine synthase [Nocardia carnea]|uniref:tRNA-dihydrouridine synthase n=1 Tax=Nocardia carnea TaxID=37328 RepID=UPI002454CA41|nr:tRNA-dihydrouridine synthase [Nocardia carnea]